MKLRNRKSYLTNLPEGSAPVNVRPKITQIIYFSILGLIVAYIISIGIGRLLYLKAGGQVEVEKTLISSTRGGHISSLKVREGQHLQKGDLIVRIDAIKRCVPEENRPLQKLRLDIALNEQRIILLKAKQAELDKLQRGGELRRALELERDSVSYGKQFWRDQNKLTSDLVLTGRELELQHVQLKDMEKDMRSQIVPAECRDEVIRAPFAARVQVVRRRVQEFTKRGEAIVILTRNNAPVRIEAYFTEDELKYITLGKQIDVTFPDGVESSGVVKAVYSSAYSVPEREWKGYRPLTSGVRVHLFPLNKGEEINWKQYDRMEVKVRAEK
ncbi:MAG TPA: biotin/lipoyl-binding protein [Gammaproteobacteria bacterium]|nr:biotin/lipoyl-binding protein [Gammaproteobacteria bacterium]